MAFFGSVVRFLVRRAVADARLEPRVRKAAAKTAASAVREAREIVNDPSPARRLGRIAGRVKRRVSETVRGEE